MTKILRLMLGVAIICFSHFAASAQSLSINTDGSTAAPSALLDVKSTVKGMLIPRMSKTEKNSIATPATGLLIFQATPDSIGFHYYNGTKWVWLTDATNADTTAWKINGNDNITASKFLGTTNDSALRFRVKNIPAGIIDSASANTAIGFRDLSAIQPLGKANTAFGYKSLLTNTTGINNVGLGYEAGLSNDTGTNNISIGYLAQYFNRNNNNVAIGSGAAIYLGQAGTFSTENTAVGTDAAQGFYMGPKSTAIGYRALYNHSGNFIYGNSIGRNTAIGDSAMAYASGASNVAIGTNAMGISYGGDYNVAIGDSAMGAAQNSVANIAIGYRSLTRTSANYPNTAIGYYSQDSASTGYANTSLGSFSLTRNLIGYNNTAIGNASMQLSKGTQLTDNTAVGNGALQNTRYYGQTAFGSGALGQDTSGIYNTAVGYLSMYQNLRGFYNTAVGTSALRSDTTGSINTAIGVNAMYYHVSGDNNVAMGYQALLSDVNGGANTAIGTSAMANHKTNGLNTAVGYETMFYDTASSYTAAYGYRALRYTKNGFENTALGVGAIEYTDSSFYNTAVGRGAMFQKGGTFNTTVGYFAAGEGAGANTKIYTAGTTNIGAYAGFRTKADENTFVGYYSGAGLGTDTLTGIQNTGLGAYSLYNSTTGQGNTAGGHYSQLSNTTGNWNTSFGSFALNENTTGDQNTAIGHRSLNSNILGVDNVGTGYYSLVFTTGNRNTAIGTLAGKNNVTGNNNTFVGDVADVLQTGLTNATAVGANAAVNQSNSMVLGSINGVNSATANTFIGIGTTTPTAPLHVANITGPTDANAAYFVSNNSTAAVSNGSPVYAQNTYSGGADVGGVIGRADNLQNWGYGGYFVGGFRGVYGVTPSTLSGAGSSYGVYGQGSTNTTGTNYGVYGTATGAATNYGVFCSGNGGYTGTWTLVSDQRFKKNIQTIDGSALSSLMKLNPVSYLLKTDEYKNMNFPTGTQYGFVAQELEKVFPLLVENGTHPAESKTDPELKFKAVNYIGLIPVLTRSIQEQQSMIETQQTQIDDLKKKNDQLEKDMQLIKAKLAISN